MLAQVQKELRDLIARNRIAQFFDHWAATIDPRSEHANVVTLRQSDFTDLQRQERLGIIERQNAATRRAQIVYSLLGVVDDLTPADLLGATPESAGTAVASSGPSPALRALLQRKLDALQHDRALATDASVKFKLDEEIREIKEQLGLA